METVAAGGVARPGGATVPRILANTPRRPAVAFAVSPVAGEPPNDSRRFAIQPREQRARRRIERPTAPLAPVAPRFPGPYTGLTRSRVTFYHVNVLVPLGICRFEALLRECAGSAPEGLFVPVNMAHGPAVKRAVGFFDGQNLYRHAKDAFRHHHPNYHPVKLFDAVCADRGWENRGVRFYTGIPAARHDEMWHGYWTNRLLAMRREGVHVESRPLRYRARTLKQADGSVVTDYVAQEKGIDLRLGLDVVRLSRVNQLDVAVIFSQDQDLAEVVRDVRKSRATVALRDGLKSFLLIRRAPGPPPGGALTAPIGTP